MNLGQKRLTPHRNSLFPDISFLQEIQLEKYRFELPSFSFQKTQRKQTSEFYHTNNQVGHERFIPQQATL
jgi:hypothetical protein